MIDYLYQYNRSKNPSNRTGRGTPQPGEVWWVENLDGIKDRPVLVLKYSSERSPTANAHPNSAQYAAATP